MMATLSMYLTTATVRSIPRSKAFHCNKNGRKLVRRTASITTATTTSHGDLFLGRSASSVSSLWNVPARTVSTSAVVLQQSSSFSSSFQTDDELTAGYSRPVVQWYPGHIAKAERMLQETFKAVDVVVEVRDARAAKATSHPMVGSWCAGRPRIVVLTHTDQIPSSSRRTWLEAYQTLGAEHLDDTIDRQLHNQAQQAFKERLKYAAAATAAAANSKKQQRLKKDSSTQQPSSLSVEDVLFVNAKEGAGIHALSRAIIKAGAHVQERRERRGLKDRPLRVGIIGFPNVGKSALINKLLGRRRAKTANTPGVTRSLQWIRVRPQDGSSNNKNEDFELLDSPGIIPASLVDQSDALLLAACNCIGQAAYDNQAVAAYLCEWIMSLHRLGYGSIAAPSWKEQCKTRYGFDPMVAQMTGEDMLYAVADRTCQGNPEDAARKILQDFRAGRMGLVCLQVAPSTDGGKQQVSTVGSSTRQQAAIRQQQQEIKERAQSAIETAKELGLELPPIVFEQQQQQQQQQQKEDSKTAKSVLADNSSGNEVGKGLFEGW